MKNTNESYQNNNGTLERVRRVAIRNGKGELCGWLEQVWSRELGWVTIPAREENES